MRNKAARRQSGFTMIEAAVVILLAGIIMAFATPKIVNAMREHRLSMAVREVSDQIQRARAQAIQDNATRALMVDTSGRQLGLAIYVGGVIPNASSAYYVPLPQGITFQTPTGVVAPLAGTPTGSAVSFPSYGGSATVLQQDFTSRGFPSVAAGTMNAIYLTNGVTYRAITMSSYGNIRTWWWEGGAWVAAR
jgi:prepilin-type N-terminal cleavage/methylation domain-containing protein